MPTSPSASQDEWTALNRLCRMLEEFLKLDPSMTVQKALTLTTIATSPELTVKELSDRTGVPMQTTATHVDDLGPDGPWRLVKKKKPALGVIEYPTDYNDRRRKPCNISSKGRRVIVSLVDLLTR